MRDRILSTLGLCKKAGFLKSGDQAVMDAVKEHKALLVIIAENASDNTKKRFKDKCSFRNIPCFTYSEKEQLGKALGSGEKAVVAVTDKGFSESITKILTRA